MAMFQTVDDLLRHGEAVIAGLSPLIPSNLPPEIAAAVAEIAELNEHMILTVVTDAGTQLPTGRDATRLLRSAWNEDEGTFALRTLGL